MKKLIWKRDKEAKQGWFYLQYISLWKIIYCFKVYILKEGDCKPLFPHLVYSFLLKSNFWWMWNVEKTFSLTIFDADVALPVIML